MTRLAILALALVVALIPLAGCGNRGEEELYTIGVLQINSNPNLDATREGFIDGLKQAGYEDGKNIHLLVKNAQGDIATAQLIAQQFTEEADMIMAISTPCLQAAIKATSEKPIIFGEIANAYVAGAGTSATDHLPNVTGAFSFHPIKETLQLLLEIKPEAKRVGVLWNPAQANSVFNVELEREGAQELGLELVEVTVSNSSDVLMAAQTLATKEVDAIVQVSDNVVYAAFDSLVKVADEQYIPLFSNSLDHAKQGAAVALGWDFYDNGLKSAELAVRVMEGENPADIPFQGLDKMLLHVNPAAAQRQGLTIPPSLLERADQVLGEVR
jgi:ABC-type uncharacterized transport system substrate-binding protein